MPRAFHYDRHPSATVILRCERSEPRRMHGPDSPRPSPFEALASLGHLRVTVSMSAARQPFGIFRILHHHTSPLVSARRWARGSSRFLLPTPNEGGGGAPRGATLGLRSRWRGAMPRWQHAAIPLRSGRRPSALHRGDFRPRDHASTPAVSTGSTLRLAHRPARSDRLGPVPPAPGFASTSHGTPRLAPSGGSSPETPLMSENESCVA
jgi:hypothetical protein